MNDEEDGLKTAISRLPATDQELIATWRQHFINELDEGGGAALMALALVVETLAVEKGDGRQ